MSGRDTQCDVLRAMDALMRARRNPELSTAGPRTSTAGPRTTRDWAMGGRPFLGAAKKHSNKRSAIIKEIRENLVEEKSGTVACYNHYIFFCEQLKLDPHVPSNLRAFRKKALDNFIQYGSKYHKSTYKYSTPIEITSQASSVSTRDLLKRAWTWICPPGRRLQPTVVEVRTSKRISKPPVLYAPPEAVERVALRVQLFDSPIHGTGVRILEDADDGMHIMFLEGAFRKTMCNMKSYVDGAPREIFDSAAEINGRLV